MIGDLDKAQAKSVTTVEKGSVRAGHAVPRGEKAKQWASTHRRILDAARSRLEEDGYHDTSMAGIARRAGVTRTAIYLHFDSKASIVSDLVRELPPAFVDIERAFERPLDPNYLRTWVGTVVGWFRAHSALMRALYVANAQDAEVAAELVKLRDQLVLRATHGRQLAVDDLELARVHLMLGQLDWFCRGVVDGTWTLPASAGVDGLVSLWTGGFDASGQSRSGGLSPSSARTG